MSQSAASPPLQRTCLHAAHVGLGARLVPFGGWEMPVQYTSILEEHQAVRSDVGLFDVSHMGEFLVSGPGAAAFVDHVVANDVSRLAADQALYTQLVRPDGGTVDDLLVYRRPEGFLLVVNASNIGKDWAWLQAHLPEDVVLEDRSAQTAMVALQGPRAEALIAPLLAVDAELAALKPFRWVDTYLGEAPVTVARTGYTGEDGFELFCQPADAEGLWRALIQAGARPAGLGARDTLRLEAGLPLYGHELTEAISPVMAGLGWSVRLDKGEFLGREALARHRAGNLTHRVVGLTLEGRNIARQGYAVYAGERAVGEVLSGTFSPSLQIPIATALVEADAAAAPLAVEIRGQRHAATTVKLPFYRRPPAPKE